LSKILLPFAMLSIYLSTIALAAGARVHELGRPSVAQRMPACKEVEVVQDFNLTEYIRATWYIQKQQVNAYQPLKKLHCVAATYNETFRGKKSTVPFFKGSVVSVFNYHTDEGKTKSPKSLQSADPKLKRSFASPLCARVPDPDQPAKLSVAPCKLSNRFAGAYWVVEAGPRPDDYQWAIVTAGQPTLQYEDGCTTPVKCKGLSSTDCGLWFFTRDPVPSKSVIDTLDAKAKALGISTQLLKTINHEGCTYPGYAAKANERA